MLNFKDELFCILKNKSITIVSIIVILALFWKPINDVISNYVIPLTKDVPESPYIALIFILTPCIVALLHLDYLKSERKTIAYRHLWEMLALTLYLLFKNTGSFSFYSAFGYYFDYFACMFISIILIEIAAFVYRIAQKRKEIQTTTTPFYVDSPTVEDKYGRKEYIPVFLNKIYSTFAVNKGKDNGNSFAILMSEEFGYGKTSLLYQIRETIKTQYSENFVYIDFKPWLCDSPDSIIKEYFSLMQKELDKHLSIPKGMFETYVRLLIDKSPTNIYTLGLKMLNSTGSLSSEHDTIKAYLSKVGKPIVITIDDVDRLHKEEMRVVLNLIRDTADFNNIFYIIAADKTNLKHLLERLDIKDADAYLKKFINFEFLFPANDNVIQDLLNEHLESVLQKWFGADETNKHKNAMLSLEGIYNAFESPRDLYRFLNVFSYALDSVMANGLRNDINFEDLFAISFVQYANPAVYKLLRDNDEIILTYDNTSGHLCVNNECREFLQSPSTQQLLERLESWNNPNHKEEKKDSVQSEAELRDNAIRSRSVLYKEAISYIFNKRTEVDASRMRYPDAYFRYFSYKLKNSQLLGTKVLQMLFLNNEVFESNIRNVITNGQEKSFVHVVQRNAYTLKGDSLNIYQKIQIFILQLCKLKPDVVDRHPYYGIAIMVENAIRIYDLDSLLRSLYYDDFKFDHFKRDDKLKEQYNNNRKNLASFIMSDDYDINVMSLFLIKAGNHIEHLIFSEDDLEKWSAHIIDSFVTKMKVMTSYEVFSRDILYTIMHLSQLNHAYWIDAFAAYLNRSSLYKEWLAHIISFENGNFVYNVLFTKDQFDFNNISEWKSVLEPCKKINKTAFVKDLMAVLDSDLNNLELAKHPYLQYVKDYWSNNEIHYCLKDDDESVSS